MRGGYISEHRGTGYGPWKYNTLRRVTKLNDTLKKLIRSELEVDNLLENLTHAIGF